MLKVKANKINPYEVTKVMLDSGRISASINTEEIKIDGDFVDSILRYVLDLDIISVTNIEENSEELEEEQESVSEETECTENKGVQIQEEAIWKNGHRTHIPARPPKNPSGKEKSPCINNWQIWYVDFGEPFESEWGYEHYAVVYHKSENSNTFVVYPCTSQYRSSNMIYRTKFTEKNVSGIDKEFLKISKDTYIILEERENIAPSRFIKCIGTLKKDAREELLKAIKDVEEREKSKSLNEKSKVDISIPTKNKGNIELTAKEKELLDKACFADILAIVNNGNYSYTRKVEALLNKFELPIIKDGKLLIDLIKRAKYKKRIDYVGVLKDMSAEKCISQNMLKTRLNNLMIKKFSGENCLLDFVALINKLAS